MTRIFDRNPVQGHRPQPWKPPLSTDAKEPPPNCFGDLVRARAEVEGRIGSPTIGTPGDGDHNLVESWYERHPEKLPDNPQTMTNAAKKVTRTPGAAKVKGQHAAKVKGQRRRRERERAGRKVIDGTGGFNRGPTKRRRLPIFHKPAMLAPYRRDPLRRRAPAKAIKRFTNATAADSGMRGA